MTIPFDYQPCWQYHELSYVPLGYDIFMNIRQVTDLRLRKEVGHNRNDLLDHQAETITCEALSSLQIIIDNNRINFAIHAAFFSGKTE